MITALVPTTRQITQYDGGILLLPGNRFKLYAPRNIVGHWCSDVECIEEGHRIRNAQTTGIATCLGAVVQGSECGLLIHAYTPLHLNLLLECMLPEFRRFAGTDFTTHVASRMTEGTKVGAYLPAYNPVLNKHALHKREYHTIVFETTLRVGHDAPSFPGSTE